VAVSYGDPDQNLQWLADRLSPRVMRLPERLEGPRRQLDEYFAGRRRQFELPLDWGLTWGFRRVVLQHLAGLPFGETVTYGRLADAVGHPGAARAVGSAMASNPMPIVVPCHRVVAAGGKLGGYTGGIDKKRALLGLEGADGDQRLF
jgi:methylated-DNA-[protein]-cysteine S-methyltransferase